MAFVTCLECRVFTLKSDPVRSFHSLEFAFYSKIVTFSFLREFGDSIQTHQKHGDCTWGFVKLFFVAVHYIETERCCHLLCKRTVGNCSCKNGTSWSALKLRQVEWPYLISDEKNEQENTTYIIFLFARSKDEEFEIHMIKQGTFHISEKKHWKARTNKLKWCGHNWCEMRWIRWEFVGPCWQKRFHCRFGAGAIQTSFPLNKLQSFPPKNL